MANINFEDKTYAIFSNEITFQSEGSDMIGQSLDTFRWAGYHNIQIMDTPDLPSKHHHFLLLPIVLGFTLQDKQWSKSRWFILSTSTSSSAVGNLVTLWLHFPQFAYSRFGWWMEPRLLFSTSGED